MKKSSHRTEDANAFKVSGWFRKLWKGTLFGKQKDKLILRILKLGGKSLLMSDCGLRLDMDMIDSTPAPSMKQLLTVLRKAEAEFKDTQESLARGASTLSHPEDYNIEEKVLINSRVTYCSMGICTPKKPSVIRSK